MKIYPVRTQARLAPGAASGAQRDAPTLAPRAVPSHDALATDPESPGNRALRLLARGKQPRGLLPTTFQCTEIASRSNMRGGHVSIVRRRRQRGVTILCEIQ